MCVRTSLGRFVCVIGYKPDTTLANASEAKSRRAFILVDPMLNASHALEDVAFVLRVCWHLDRVQREASAGKQSVSPLWLAARAVL